MARQPFRMEPVDAMWHWLSGRFGTDQFITYVFAGRPPSMADAIAAALDRARRHPDLALRVREDRSGLRYPLWVPGEVAHEQCTDHALADPTWAGFLDALADLTRHQLDPREHAWRLHVFGTVSGVPGGDDATVVVAQFAHALGDGLRSAALAGVIFGRDRGPDAVVAPDRRSLPWRLAATVRERRALARDVADGRIAAARPMVPALSTNRPPGDQRVLRTLVRTAGSLPGPTPTVGALVAVSDALAGYMTVRGEDPTQLTAGVPIARSGAPQAFNHIDTALVGLYPTKSRAARIPLIAADLVAGRLRVEHPAVAAREHLFAAIPAGVRHRGVRRADFSTVPAAVPGHTVVSSVDRGPADLSFGGCPALFTAGYPGLLPICNLAHGVHLLGDTVAVSVHATPATDVDEYVDRLAAALDG